MGEEGAIHLRAGVGRRVASAGAPEEILDHLAAAMPRAAVVRVRGDASEPGRVRGCLVSPLESPAATMQAER